MSEKVRSPELQAQLERLAAMADEDIDLSDIPEIPEEAWLNARRPGLYKARKTPVTLRLDADVVDWFKAHAQERGYQTEINSVLRRHVAEAEGSRTA